MKKLLAVFTANTQKQLIEQAEKHAMEIAAMKETNMEKQNLLTTKPMPAQPINDHRASAHFTVMTKPSEILSNVKPENWPEFEHHPLNKAENPTIGWNRELLNFQLMDTTTKPFNLLEGYFDIPETMIGALHDDLQRAKQEDLMKPASQLYRLHSLKTKLKNCLTQDLALNIETSMPTGLSNKDGRNFLSRLSHTPSQTKKPTNASSTSTSSNWK
jgi:hypothetical protein